MYNTQTRQPMMDTMTISDHGYMTLPFQVRFENALKEPNILIKCKLLTDLIYESTSTNIKEMQHRYVLLIEDIFSCNPLPYGSINNWRLKSLTKETAPKEFDSIFFLLSIDGPIFKLIRHLMSNDQTMNNRHEFSINHLPLSLRNLDNIVNHHFFMDKMSTSSSSTLSLNAFEFFLFHFACYITKEETTTTTTIVANNSFAYNSTLSMGNMMNNEDTTLNVLYYILLENYLEFFIPITDANLSSMKSTALSTSSSSSTDKTKDSNIFHMKSSSLWKSLSSTTTNLWNLSSSSTNNIQQQQQPGYGSYGRPMKTMFNDTITNSDRFMSEQNSSLAMKNPIFGNRGGGSSIFNPEIFNQFQRQQNLMLNNNNNNIAMIHDPNDPIGSVSYKCDTILRIFSEIWLTIGSFTVQRDDNNRLRMITATTGHHQFNVTIEHMRVVRIFIKHLHYFSNNSHMKNKYNDYSVISSGDQINSGGFVSGSLNASLDELKRSLWSGTKYSIQKNLYAFLRIVFDRWPNDSTFRIPLETWLSYIQPWRYIPGRNSNETLTHDRYDWRRFIDENIVFYTTLFRQVITRMARQLDLGSANNSLLLFRVLKVFSQDSLKEMMKESEIKFLNAGDLSTTATGHHGYGGHQSTSSLFSHRQSSPYRMHNSSSDKNVTLLEAELFHQSEYISIFSPGFRDQIIELLLKIAKSLHTVTELQNKSSSANNNSKGKQKGKSETLFESIVNFFTIDYSVNNQSNVQTSRVNYDKIRNHLNASIEFISCIFDIPQQSIETILANARKSVVNNNNDDDADIKRHRSKEEIYELVNGVPKLTEFGLSQIMNGSLKLDKLPTIVEGNPDRQPIRSYEIGILVKLTLFLSTVINQKFGPIFQSYYEQPNFYGTLCRILLSSPVSYAHYERCPQESSSANNGGHHQKPKIRIEKLPPRINLRFMASFGFLLQTFLFFTFLWLAQCIDCVTVYLLISFVTIFITLLCKLF
nr:LOW QUALITY PROTEIN: sphingomyelin phosphodiesterase 4-like [Dermatophagoides farinae]